MFPASKPLEIFKLNLLLWTREMTQMLVELGVLEKYLGSIPGILVMLTAICKPSFRGYFLTAFLTCAVTRHTHGAQIGMHAKCSYT